MARYTKTKRPAVKVGVEQDMQKAEQIQDGLETFFEKLVEHRYWVLGGIAALFLLIVGITVVNQRMHARTVAGGADVAAAVASLQPVQAAGTDEAARKDAATKALAVIEPLLANHAGSQEEVSLRYLKAVAQIEAGQAAAAMATLEVADDVDPGTAFDLPLLLVRARAKAVAGDAAGAAQLLDGAVADMQGLARLLLRKALGDLYNPHIGDAASAVKDAEKALHEYNDALVHLKERQVGRPSALEEFYKNEIEKRIAFLKG